MIGLHSRQVYSNPIVRSEDILLRVDAGELDRINQHICYILNSAKRLLRVNIDTYTKMFDE